MTATNMCYNFVGFRYSPPLSRLATRHEQMEYDWLKVG